MNTSNDLGYVFIKMMSREETGGESFSCFIKILPNSYARKRKSFGRVKT